MDELEVDTKIRTESESPRFPAADVKQFQRDGYVIARQLVDGRLRQEMLQAALDGLERTIEPIEYEADLKYVGAPNSRDARGGHTVRRLKQVHARHMAFTRWVIAPELVGRLQQLLGNEIVMPLAHHNCIMTKQPHYSSDTGWHQDIRYWSFHRDELVSVWVALGQETPENGCLKLIPGSHKIDFDRNRLDDALFLRPNLSENQELIDSQIHAELKPGDVLFFHCRTLHAASRNYTDDTKFSVVTTFRPGDNPPVPGTRSASLPELLIPTTCGGEHS